MFALFSPSSVHPLYNDGSVFLILPYCNARVKQAQSCLTFAAKCTTLPAVEGRRSANYHPSIWEPKRIQSLSTPFNYEFHATRLEELKDKVRRLVVSTKDPCIQLNLIDSIQRLGVAYHFEELIRETLTVVELGSNKDLYTTSLHFRLLREHGFPVSSDVFDKFRDGNGRFEDNLAWDLEGLMSLYEASHLRMNGEDALEKAKNFSMECLKSLVGKLNSNNVLVDQVKQSLEVPLYWRLPRVEARNFIDIYQRSTTKNLDLLELAKLDYNLVQSVYQRELNELSRWWRDLNFKEKLPFSRDRLMENYLWAMGIIFEPQFSQCRIGLTKFVCILTAIDDIYDIYGSLDELELFTNAVTRWDTEAMCILPEYMKICYYAMFNFGNALAHDMFKEYGFDILLHIRKEWANLCGSYLTEARWFYNGYTPTSNEYLGNAWISVGGQAAIVHALMLQGQIISKDSLSCLKNGSELIYWSSLITRLNDDLGTSTAEIIRGDVAKAIQCYMMEEGTLEEEARDHIKGLISYSWNKLNEETAKHSNLKSLVSMCLNMARASQCIFQHGDGIGTSNGVTKDRLTSLIVEQIPINQP